MMYTLVCTIFGAKKKDCFLANLMVLIPKMILTFHGYQQFLLFCNRSFLEKKDQATVLADHKIQLIRLEEVHHFSFRLSDLCLPHEINYSCY